MDTNLLFLALALGVVVIWGALAFWPRPRIVREHERGLRYRRGHLIAELTPGRYWLRPRIEELLVVDKRRKQLIVAGQEVLTEDRVPLKVSLIADFNVEDVRKAISEVESYQEVLYSRLQLALRQAVSDRALDSALAERGELGQAIEELVKEDVAHFGITLHSVSVRDFMMAGGLRNSYADVVEAKQQGLAALERARGESAAVRSLANAAQMMEKHPGLMQLRLLQAVEAGSGNRIVISMDPERGDPSGVEVLEEEDE